MGDRLPDRPATTSTKTDAPQVRLVDLNGLNRALHRAAADVARRAQADVTLKAQIRQHGLGDVLERELEQAVQRELISPNGEVVMETSVPHYRGQRGNGNPITYLLMHYRLKIETGAFYQSDLMRDDEKLWNALRNVFKSKFWRHVVESAAHDLQSAGRSTIILGRDLTTVSELREILPARKAINPERKRSAEPTGATN
jgi:hypothetical protein